MGPFPLPMAGTAPRASLDGTCMGCGDIPRRPRACGHHARKKGALYAPRTARVTPDMHTPMIHRATLVDQWTGAGTVAPGSDDVGVCQAAVHEVRALLTNLALRCMSQQPETPWCVIEE